MVFSRVADPAYVQLRAALVLYDSYVMWLNDISLRVPKT